MSVQKQDAGENNPIAEIIIERINTIQWFPLRFEIPIIALDI